MKELYPSNDWRKIADEAAAWFRHEMSANFGISVAPTRKRRNRKDENISIIKMLIAQENTFFVSDRCKKFVWELENYVTDDAGNLPDGAVHLMDCFDYSIPALNVKTRERLRNSELKFNWVASESNRRIKIKELPNKNSDWGDNVFEDSLSYDPCDY